MRIYLDLSDNKIKDIKALANLTKLEVLDLIWNRISNIEPNDLGEPERPKEQEDPKELENPNKIDVSKKLQEQEQLEESKIKDENKKDNKLSKIEEVSKHVQYESKERIGKIGDKLPMTGTDVNLWIIRSSIGMFIVIAGIKLRK